MNFMEMLDQELDEENNDWAGDALAEDEPSGGDLADDEQLLSEDDEDDEE